MKPISFFSPAGLGLIVPLLLLGCAQTNNKQSAPVAQENRAVSKASVPVEAPVPSRFDKGQKEYIGGIASYENGSYKVAARQFQSALTEGLETPNAEAQAHKYLAFMHCAGGRQRQCRAEFRKALAADPAFDLTAAEAGHPIWGPIFRKLKVPAKARKK